MNRTFGEIGIFIGLLAAFGGIVAIGQGMITKREALCRRVSTYCAIALIGVVVSVTAMEHGLLTHDFSLAFVAGNNSKETPLLYSVTGLWSALQGSILLWTLILCTYVYVTARHFRDRFNDPVVCWALLICLVVTVFFFGLMVGPANPFVATPGPIPADGGGPNVLLQDNPLIAIHPIFLYLGFVGFTVPFSFAMASLITGRVGESWLAQTRRFTVLAWACLTLGVMLGAWWSYQVLGWGGFWGWDPVENAALLPWLTGTAYLHSVMVQERRGLLRVWNLSLLIATFALTILATFLTRSGVIASVHAFSDSGLGPTLIGFFALIVISGVVLIGWRGDRLRSPGTIDSAASREGAFLVNNLLFAAFAFVVLLGTVFPLFIQAINGESLSVGRPYFDTLTVPIGVALLFFMAVAPVLPWRKAGSGVLRERLALPGWGAVLVIGSCVFGGVRGLLALLVFGIGTFAGLVAIRQLVLAAIAARRHGYPAWHGLIGRANGGMIAHIGVVVIAVGLSAASSFGHSELLSLKMNQQASFDGHRFTLVGVRAFRTSNKSGNEALVKIDGGGVFKPAFSVFNGDTEDVGTPAIDSSFLEDVYLSPYRLTSASKGTPASAEISVIIQPLVVWLWIGGALIALGAVLAVVPGRRRRRPTDPVSLSLAGLNDDVREAVGATR